MKPKDIKLKLSNNVVVFDAMKAEWKPDIKSKGVLKGE